MRLFAPEAGRIRGARARKLAGCVPGCSAAARLFTACRAVDAVSSQSPERTLLRNLQPLRLRIDSPAYYASNFTEPSLAHAAWAPRAGQQSHNGRAFFAGFSAAL